MQLTRSLQFVMAADSSLDESGGGTSFLMPIDPEAPATRFSTM